MPLNSLFTAKHIDFQLRTAGEVVTYGNQSGYGLLDSPDLDVTDQTGMRMRGYARVLVVREGKFTGLAEDQTINHAGIPYLIRDVGSAGADGLRRLAVTRATPVDHLAISPTSVFLVATETLQLTATAYDVAGNVLSGRSISWSSSDLSVVAIDAVTGLATGGAIGSCTITATSEGKTVSASAIVALPLQTTLDWSPLVRRADLAQPLGYVHETGGHGTHQGFVQQIGSGLLGIERVSYPKSVDEWSGVAAITVPAMSDTLTPNANYVSSATQLLDQGPYDNTTAWKIVPNDAYGHSVTVSVPWRDPGAADSQDVATWKRGMAVAVAAARPADVGKSIRINFVDMATYPGGAGWYTYAPIKYQDVVLHAVGLPNDPSTWDFVGFNFDSRAQFAGKTVQIAITMAPPDPATPIVQYLYAPYASFNWQVDDATPENWRSPLPFHETLGVYSAYQHQNSWGADCDDPPTYNGGTKAATAVAAPDSNRYYGGRTLKQFTLANGQGIQTTAAYRVEDSTGVGPPSNAPVRQGGAAWIHWYIEPGTGALPADGALNAYILKAGGPTYGPIAMVRDPWRALQRANGGAFYRARVPINLAGEGYLDFSARIVNESGAPLLFNAYRAAMTAETQRSYGLHNAVVPARAVTGPVYSDSAWQWIANAQKVVTVDEGVWIFRATVPWSPGELPNLHGNAGAGGGDHATPTFWQSGPFGSGDRTFEGGVMSEDATHVRLVFVMARGAPCPNPQDYRSWSVLITGIPAANLLAAWPAMVDFDVALAWKNCAIVKFGIALGAGTAPPTWLSNGGTFLGGNVSITSAPGLAWTIDGDTDGHLGIGDLDKVAETQGWYSVIAAAGAGSVDPTTVQASIEYQLFKRTLARRDLR